MILFLDFDGVLHPDPCFDRQRLFERAPLLAEVLDEFAEVSVVLSTSWRTQYHVHEMAALLPGELQPRVVGVTPLFGTVRPMPALAPYPREAECNAWMAASDQPERQWLALDDRASLFNPYCERLIRCDSSTGLTVTVVTRLRSRLALARARLISNLDTLL